MGWGRDMHQRQEQDAYLDYAEIDERCTPWNVMEREWRREARDGYVERGEWRR